MFGFLCKRVVVTYNSRVLAGYSGNYQLGIVEKAITLPIFKSFSSCSKATKKDVQQEHSFTVSYLVNSCGLSLESAISVSKRVNFRTPERPDSVLTFLRHHGFTKNHFSRLFRIQPKLLLLHPQRIFLPKIKYFRSIGISNADIVEIVYSNPVILGRSLENHLIPWCNFLKSVLPSEGKVIGALKRVGRFVSIDMQNDFAPNTEALRQLGVPKSFVSHAVICYYNVLAQDRKNFDKLVEEVLEMGFNPKKVEFIQAMQVFSSMPKSSIENKIELLRKWGWPLGDVQLAFRKHPMFMSFSEKKISNVMDFLINKMGFQLVIITQNPKIFHYNLEKRIIPRCLLVKVLLAKGLIKKSLKPCSFVCLTEKQFLDKFVTKYLKEEPELLNIYQGKVNLLELEVRSENIYVG